MENTEGSEGTPTKISDSGYSNSCGNSQSQRSGSSKSRHSGSNSSGSSGYGGKASSSLTNSNEATPQPLLKHKELKKKKLKSVNSPETSIITDRVNSWNSSASAERIVNDEDNNITPAPQNNIVSSASQQLKDELNKDCLTPKSIHSIQDSHNPSPRNDDINLPSSSISPLKTARFPIPLTGDVLSTPGSLGGKVTDDEITNYNSPPKLTEAHFVIKNTPPCIKNKPDNQFVIPKSGFSCVVSMKDGVVLYTNTSLTTCLGYPKDMWLGRSFIDFVHPKDRSTFSSHITSGIAMPIIKSPVINKEPDGCSVLFCRIRKYRGLRGGPDNSGYGVRERDICYMPFQLDFSFRDIINVDETGIFLMITAIPVTSPYIDWKGTANMFTTRHSSTGTLSHIDPEAVAFIGFLPQEIIGRNIFDFYHPEDMPYLKDAYETVIQLESGFKSRPYRFYIHNGEYITLETEWSAYINPWSRKLEFIVGHHRVLQLPINADVFQCVKTDFSRMFSDDKLKMHRQCQDEIMKIMNEVLIKPSELEKNQINKRCKDLAMFMDGFNKIPIRSEEELRIEIPKEKSLSERDSVMLGEISPHHDYYDSKSSTGTPPSYNQLNYTENLQRFFESHPLTLNKNNTSDLKATNTMDHSPSSPELFIPESYRKKCYSPCNNGSNDCGSSDESNVKFYYSRHMPKPRHIHYPSTSKRHIQSPHYENLDYKPTHLTQDLLNKHNSMMEKLLVKQHKEARSVSKAEEREKSDRREKKNDYGTRAGNMYPMNHMHTNQMHTNQMQYDIDNQEHGVKRPGSMMWETDNDPHKIVKQIHLPQNPQNFHSCQRLVSGQIELQTSRLDGKMDMDQNQGPNTYIPAENIPHHHRHYVHHINAPTAGCASPMSPWPPFSGSATPMEQPLDCNEPLNLQTHSNIDNQNIDNSNNINYPNIDYQNIDYQNNIGYQNNVDYHRNSMNYSNVDHYQNNIDNQNIKNPNVNNPHVIVNPNVMINPNSMMNSNISNPHVNNPRINNPNMNNLCVNNPNMNDSNINNHPYQSMYPAVYLIPAQQGSLPQQETSRTANSNVQYMMYLSTMFGTQPIMYSNMTMAYQPMPVTSNNTITLNNNISTVTNAPIKPLGLPFDNYRQTCQRPVNKPMKTPNSFRHGMGMAGRSSTCMASRTTPVDSQNASLKAELGSRVGSHSSRRLPNTINRCPCVHLKKNQCQPLNRPIEIEIDNNSRKDDDIDGEGSSYSSFYSSILRADSSNSTENVESDVESSPKSSSRKFSHSNDKYYFNKMRKQKSTNSKRMMWNKLSQSNDSSAEENAYYQDRNCFGAHSSSNSSNRRQSYGKPRLPRPSRKHQPPWMDSVKVTPDLINRYQMNQRNIDDVLREDQETLDAVNQPSLVNEQLSQLYMELQLEGLPPKLKLDEGISSSSSDDERVNNRRRKRKQNKAAIIYEENAPMPSPSSD